MIDDLSNDKWPVSQSREPDFAIAPTTLVFTGANEGGQLKRFLVIAFCEDSLDGPERCPQIGPTSRNNLRPNGDGSVDVWLGTEGLRERLGGYAPVQRVLRLVSVVHPDGSVL